MKLPRKAIDCALIKPGSSPDLKEFDPGATPGFDPAEAEAFVRAASQRIDELQYTLFAENARAVLIILQGMDTSGKDGTIRSVFEGVNPVGVKVHSFKAPNPTELEHDYLWRHHSHTPPRGEVGVHNRSHYESVLIERVRGIVPPEVWKDRYAQINAFEQMLAASGTLVLKFMLHISRDEQLERLRERYRNPARRWKFNPGDLEERKLWDQYMLAYEDALAACSTPWAPWHVVRADKKWYRNAVVAGVIVEALERMDLRLPEPKFDVEHFPLQ